MNKIYESVGDCLYLPTYSYMRVYPRYTVIAEKF